MIDLSKEITNRNGEKVTSKVKVPYIKTLENGEHVEEIRMVPVTLTLGKALRDSVLSSSLMSALTIEEKLDRYNLFLKIEKDEEVELSEEEVKNLTQYACDRYEIVYFGAITNLMK